MNKYMDINKEIFDQRFFMCGKTEWKTPRLVVSIINKKQGSQAVRILSPESLAFLGIKCQIKMKLKKLEGFSRVDMKN